jgi:protein ImuB
VLAFEGPERIAGEWWSDAFDRDYYRVRLDGLGDCWVFRDGADGRLYLHGFFD